MKSIRANLKEKQKRYPQKGTWCCLVEVVRSKNYNRRTVYDNFIELMPRDEYDEEDITGLVSQLHSVSKQPEDSTSEVKNPPREEKMHLMIPVSNVKIQTP